MMTEVEDGDVPFPQNGGENDHVTSKENGGDHVAGKEAEKDDLPPPDVTTHEARKAAGRNLLKHCLLFFKYMMI